MIDDKYEYRIATDEDRHNILEFLLKNFLKDEPLSRASKMTEEQFLNVIVHIVDICLKDPFSTVVFCRKTGATAGVLLISIYRRTDEKQDFKFDLNSNASSAGIVGAILNELHNSFFSLVPNHV
ncbi:hypothetical protein GCK32_009024, partial [Trichostrongylus colubriformis]